MERDVGVFGEYAELSVPVASQRGQQVDAGIQTRRHHPMALLVGDLVRVVQPGGADPAQLLSDYGSGIRCVTAVVGELSDGAVGDIQKQWPPASQS
ncbi:hypothetical protein GCM10009558_011820 [Virgisporangium aurantiacum]